MKQKAKLKLSSAQIDSIVGMAWADRITFEEIEKRTTLSEAQVIQVMRQNLKPKSFAIWRKRVSGRITKHRKRFENRPRVRS